MEESLSDAFVHLIRYVDRHFRNEEALMEIAGYPLLKEHIQQHETLEFKTADLAELYLAGEQDITDETMDFLKTWLTDHILKEDVKTGEFIGDRDLSGHWHHGPAYTAESGGSFKACTCCDKKWSTFEDLVQNGDISAVNCMVDQYNHFLNLILFNCSCGTTLAIPLTAFIEHGVGDFELEQHHSAEAKPPYCLNHGLSTDCLPKCACKYTHAIIQQMS